MHLHAMGARLRQLRTERGMTLRAVEAATNCAVSFSLLCRVEDGRIDPGIGKVAALADLYGVSLDMIAGRDP